LTMSGSRFALNEDDRDLLHARQREIVRFLSVAAVLSKKKRAQVEGPLSTREARTRGLLRRAQRRLRLLTRLIHEATTYGLSYARAFIAAG